MKLKKSKIRKYKEELCRQVEERGKKKHETIDELSKSVYYPINLNKRIDTQKRLDYNLKWQMKLMLERQVREKEENRKVEHHEKYNDLRASRIREKIREATLKNQILIDTVSEKTGQINALSAGNPCSMKDARIL